MTKSKNKKQTQEHECEECTDDCCCESQDPCEGMTNHAAMEAYYELLLEECRKEWQKTAKKRIQQQAKEMVKALWGDLKR